MKTHTPGPWVLDARDSGWSLESNGKSVTAEPFDCSDEDARLIAAAPDLLSELKMCVEYYGAMTVMDESQTDAHDRIMLNALAAIHKAEKGNA